MYPLDWTFVCPSELIAFSDRIQEFKVRPSHIHIHMYMHAVLCVFRSRFSSRSHIQTSAPAKCGLTPTFDPTHTCSFPARLPSTHPPTYTNHQSLNAEVLGLSVDSKFSHLAWSKTPRKCVRVVCVWMICGDDWGFWFSGSIDFWFDESGRSSHRVDRRTRAHHFRTSASPQHTTPSHNHKTPLIQGRRPGRAGLPPALGHHAQDHDRLWRADPRGGRGAAGALHHRPQGRAAAGHGKCCFFVK